MRLCLICPLQVYANKIPQDIYQNNPNIGQIGHDRTKFKAR
jgi:hypothetical protein